MMHVPPVAYLREVPLSPPPPPPTTPPPPLQLLWGGLLLACSRESFSEIQIQEEGR